MKLANPVVSASVAAFIAAVAAPFGFDVNATGTVLLGGLGVIGVVAAYIEKLRAA